MPSTASAFLGTDPSQSQGVQGKGTKRRADTPYAISPELKELMGYVLTFTSEDSDRHAAHQQFIWGQLFFLRGRGPGFLFKFE